MHSDYSFLRAVAKVYAPEYKVASEGGSSFNTFIFPSRRSARFFQKFLAEEVIALTGRPIFSPQMITVNELFGKISGLKAADSIMAQYRLYESFINIRYADLPQEERSSRESFDDFFSWSTLLIKDFNDIDSYLADAGQLFRNIDDLRNLDDDFSHLSPEQLKALKSFWNVFLESSPEGGSIDKKREFASMWSIMHQLYIVFRETLKREGTGYSGMIFREVAEMLAERDFKQIIPDEYGRLVFIGFNAPNRCELALMKASQQNGRGDFYWDFCGAMVTDKANKASSFICDYVKEFPSRFNISKLCTPSDDSLECIAIPVASAAGECYSVKAILEGLLSQIPECSLEERAKAVEDLAFSTAVVLPDSNLLLPLLNIIPEEFEKVNVTMGYPLQCTQLFSFLKCMGELQRDVLERGGEYAFYHRSLSNILKHSYLASSVKAFEIVDEIVKANMVYIQASSKLLNFEDGVHADDFLPLLRKLFCVAPDTHTLCTWYKECIKELESIVPKRERNMLPGVYSLLERIEMLNLPLSKSIWFKVLFRALEQISVPFKGEPLAGLQIMGPLETRVLDFKNVIILSANEGIFPNSNAMQSFVPYNLRVAFGLPTYEMADTVSAYHFYRSIYRAEKVWFVYDTRSEGLSTGEITRYAKQLKYLYGVNVQERPFIAPLSAMQQEEGDLRVEKSPEILEELRRKRISASVLNTYRDCPMKFYLSYIVGLKREEEVQESVESDTFGTIFHNTMMRLYSPYCGKSVSAKEIENLKREVEVASPRIGKIIDDEFANVMHVKEIVGQNLIVKEVIRKYVANTLGLDASTAASVSPGGFKYISGEEVYEYDYPLDDKTVHLKGQIDRIDSLEGRVRISDYKTGKVDKASKGFSIDMLFDSNSEKSFNALFQVWFYALLYCLRNNIPLESELGLTSAIYPVRAVSKGILGVSIDKENLNKFRQGLNDILRMIYSPDIPFTCRKRSGEHCNYCDFSDYCLPGIAKNN